MSINIHYSMVIQWSDEDQVYLCSLPEFGPYTKTHGSTYEEAVRMGQEVLEILIESAIAQGETLPLPHKFQDEFAEQYPLKNRTHKITPIKSKKTAPIAMRKLTNIKSRKSKAKSHATA